MEDLNPLGVPSDLKGPPGQRGLRRRVLRRRVAVLNAGKRVEFGCRTLASHRCNQIINSEGVAERVREEFRTKKCRQDARSPRISFRCNRCSPLLGEHGRQGEADISGAAIKDDVTHVQFESGMWWAARPPFSPMLISCAIKFASLPSTAKRSVDIYMCRQVQQQMSSLATSGRRAALTVEELSTVPEDARTYRTVGRA